MNWYEYTKGLKNKLGLKRRPELFTDLKLAKGWADSAKTFHYVFLGCDGRFWVVCGADANKLNKLGYEFA